MELQPKIEPGSPPVSDSNGDRNMHEIISAMRASVDRFEEGLLARDAKHKAEIGPLQEKFELERLMRLQADEEFKRAQESYEALLKKVKENGFCEVEEMRNKNPMLKRKRVDDDDNSNVVAELRNRVAELENEKLQLEVANKKNLEIIENLRTKLASKNINADAEPLRNVCVSAGGNTEKEPQAPLQRDIVDTGHSLGASVISRELPFEKPDKVVQNNLYRNDNEGHIAGKLIVQSRRRDPSPEETKRRTKRKHQASPSTNLAPAEIERRTKRRNEAAPLAIQAPSAAPTRPTYTTCVIDLRCSPGRLATLCSVLTPEQREDVIEMGFGILLTLPKTNVNRPLLLALVNAYDLLSNQIVTPLGRFYVSISDFASVLGLPHTGRLMSTLQIPKSHERIVGVFRDKTPSQLKEMILKNPPGPTFRRAFLLFAMMSFLLPSMQPKVSPKFLPLILDIDHTERYNWSRHIFEFLVDGIRRYQNGNVVCLNGCVFILEVLYFHFQQFGALDPRAEPLPPLLYYWTEERLEDAVVHELHSPLGIVQGDARPQRLPCVRSRRAPRPRRAEGEAIPISDRGAEDEADAEDELSSDNTSAGVG